LNFLKIFISGLVASIQCCSCSILKVLRSSGYISSSVPVECLVLESIELGDRGTDVDDERVGLEDDKSQLIGDEIELWVNKIEPGDDVDEDDGNGTYRGRSDSD